MEGQRDIHKTILAPYLFDRDEKDWFWQPILKSFWRKQHLYSIQSHDNTNKFFYQLCNLVPSYLLILGRDVDFEYLRNYVAIMQAIL